MSGLFERRTGPGWPDTTESASGPAVVSGEESVSGMKISVEKKDGCRRVVDVEVGADHVREDYDRVVALFAGQVRVPGFRAGRAPANLVERRFQKQITDEARERLVPQYYRDALAKEGIAPVALVDVANVSFSKNDGLKFRVEVDVAPDFKLPKYKKLTVKRQPVDVGDAEVDRALEDLRARFARYEDVEGQTVAADDLVRVDYAGTVDGAPVAELTQECRDLGAGSDFWVPIGDPEFLPGFNAGLTGAAIGDTVTFDVTFPDGYHVKDIVGKTARYVVTVKALRRRAMPAIDQEFLKRLGVETESELRTRLKDDLIRAGENAEQARLRDEVAKELLDKADFDVPRSLVDRERNEIVRAIVQQVVRSGGTRDQLQQQREQLLSTAAQRALDRVRLSFLVTRIGDEEKITVSDEDVEARIRLMAQRYGMEPERFRAELEKRDGVDGMRNELRAERIMDFILESAKSK